MFDELSKFQDFCRFFKQLYGYVKSIRTCARLARQHHFSYDDSEIVCYSKKPGETEKDVNKRIQEDIERRLKLSFQYANEMMGGLAILSLLIGLLGLFVSVVSLFL